MPRLARLDAPGTLHHVIIRGIERRNIFRDNKDRDNLLKRLGELLPVTQTSCYAWSLLSNHAHFGKEDRIEIWYYQANYFEAEEPS